MKMIFFKSAHRRWKCTVVLDGEVLYASDWWPTIGCAAREALNSLVKTYGNPGGLEIEIGDWE